MGKGSMSKMRFRSVCPQDLPLLEKWYGMTDQFGYATGFKDFREVQEEILPAHGSCSKVSMMITDGNDQATGFICSELMDQGKDRVVWIHIIIVDPAFQNRGIGTWAVNQLLSVYESMGASFAMVSVSRRNSRGLRFWAGLGFVHSTILEKSLNASGNCDVAIMKKALAGNLAR